MQDASTSVVPFIPWLSPRYFDFCSVSQSEGAGAEQVVCDSPQRTLSVYGLSTKFESLRGSAWLVVSLGRRHRPLLGCHPTHICPDKLTATRLVTAEICAPSFCLDQPYSQNTSVPLLPKSMTWLRTMESIPSALWSTFGDGMERGHSSYEQLWRGT